MDDVDKIKQKVDIVELISERISLKKAGRNFKANCPFHSEKTPSFVVSPERQIWHCFGCSKGGDLFTFIQEYENLTFPEALKDLAQRAGVKLTMPAARSQKEKKQEIIYSLNHLSAQFYNFLLLSHPAGRYALEYLTKKRKMTIPLVKTFMLGYAPGNDALVKYLVGKKRYEVEDLIEAGLANRKGKMASDFFRNRIIFPILDIRGNVMAFSGRALDQGGGPKYINTRETPVYIKGNTFYGFNLAKDAIKKEGKVVLVEGEFDVITAHREGISNIIAVKGTALTENQIKLLKRFTQKIALCFDTDPAGTDAQRRSIELIEKEGMTTTVIIPPNAKDPDELLNEDPVSFKKALQDDINVYDYIIESALSDFDRKSAEGKKNILGRTLPHLSNIENEVIREHYLKKLAEALDSSLEAIFKQADKNRIGKETPEPAPKPGRPREEILETYLLALILQSKNPKQSLVNVLTLLACPAIGGGEVALSTPSFEKVLSYLEKFKQKTTFSAEDFAKTLPSELHSPFDTSFLAPIPNLEDEEAYQKEIVKTAKQVRILAIKKRLETLRELISTAETQKDEEKLRDYEEKFDKLSKLLAVS